MLILQVAGLVGRVSLKSGSVFMFLRCSSGGGAQKNMGLQLLFLKCGSGSYR